jgi:hypothetical protein
MLFHAFIVFYIRLYRDEIGDWTNISYRFTHEDDISTLMKIIAPAGFAGNIVLEIHTHETRTRPSKHQRMLFTLILSLHFQLV